MSTPAKVSEISAVLTRLVPSVNFEQARFSDLVVQLMMGGAKFAGFWSGETITPNSTAAGNLPAEWKLIQRFSTAALANEWRNSASCNELIRALNAACDLVEISVVDNLLQDLAGVTTAIVTDVRPGMEGEYFAWEAKIQGAQAKFPGYRGVYLQPPAPGRKPQWATLLRFDSPTSLEQWFNSPERLALLKEAEKFISQTQIQNVSTSFPGWVGIDQATGKSPANWKTAMLVLMGLFPVVNLELRFLTPTMIALHPIAASFINMVGSVATTTFVTMPLSIRAFRWWLYPAESSSAGDLKGVAIVVAIYACEIALFCRL